VSGLKPTFGRVPRDGVFGVSWTLDHTGPMARSVLDLAHLLSVMAGASGNDQRSSTRPVPDYPAALTARLDGIRVGVPEGWLTQRCEPGVMAARDEALEILAGLGAAVVSVQVPRAELAGTVAWLITVVEFAAHHDINLDRLDEMTPSAAQRLVAGARTSALDYLKAMRTRRLIQQDFDTVFEAADVIVTPATPSPAPDVATFFDDGDRLWLDKVARNFLMFNVTGMPALVLPSGFDNGLPVAIQIAAPPHRDELCLRVGHAYQLATDHHLRRPSPRPPSAPAAADAAPPQEQ
jgi:aspartyl-tRNA(Asn)/glutamyl-tRNA(Gln) amidotransferase subunit A